MLKELGVQEIELALMEKLCDELISIPLHGKIESLNVSVACGTILFEMIRQKKY